jgi:signal recognition particle receptor subunit beta
MVTGAVLMVAGSASRNFLKERHLAVVINNFSKIVSPERHLVVVINNFSKN